jgi:hypothetical protein
MRNALGAAAFATILLGQSSFAALIVTEVMSTSNAPESSPLAALDWWELTNSGPAAVLLNGHAWEDNQPMGTDTGVFPNGITIGVGESIIIHQGVEANVASSFRTAWGLSPTVQVLTQAQFTGANPFSGLSSGGDEVNVYNNLAALADNATFGASTAGVSFEWGRNNANLALSVAGQNGATQITYPSSTNTAIGSPGRSVVPEAGTILLAVIAVFSGFWPRRHRRG